MCNNSNSSATSATTSLHERHLAAISPGNSPGNSPGAAAPPLILLSVNSASISVGSRAAGRTCRLAVFKEVHLMATPSFQASFERVHWWDFNILLRQTILTVDDTLREELSATLQQLFYGAVMWMRLFCCSALFAFLWVSGTFSVRIVWTFFWIHTWINPGRLQFHLMSADIVHWSSLLS